MTRRTATVVIVAMLALMAAMPAGANPERVTYGDVRAHFEAGEGGGGVVFSLETPAAMNAAPANLFEHGIRPFPGSPWDGASFCEDDWHVLLIADIAAAFEGEPKVKRRDGVAFLSGVTIELYLDGSQLETEKSTVKRFIEGVVVDDGNLIPVHSGWWQQTGSFFAPGGLSVGSHQYGALAIVSGVGEFPIGPITFNIDGSGTGACL